MRILIDKLRTIDEDSIIILSNNPDMKVFIKEDFENDKGVKLQMQKTFVTTEGSPEHSQAEDPDVTVKDIDVTIKKIINNIEQQL